MWVIQNAVNSALDFSPVFFRMFTEWLITVLMLMCSLSAIILSGKVMFCSMSHSRWVRTGSFGDWWVNPGFPITSGSCSCGFIPFGS